MNLEDILLEFADPQAKRQLEQTRQLRRAYMDQSRRAAALEIEIQNELETLRVFNGHLLKLLVDKGVVTRQECQALVDGVIREATASRPTEAQRAKGELADLADAVEDSRDDR